MKIFNFSHPFTPETVVAIQKSVKRNIEVVTVKVNLDLTENAPTIESQMLELLKPHLAEFDGTKRIVIAAPGMVIAANALIVIIHALAGFFPEIIELRMTAGTFAFHRVIDLQNLRSETRKLR